MTTLAETKSATQILDYVQSAPKGTSRKAIEEIWHKYNGNHEKIHEAISAMWNKREDNARGNSGQQASRNQNGQLGKGNNPNEGEWESVQKRKKKADKKSTKDLAPGGDGRRGGRGRDGRNRGRGHPSVRGSGTQQAPGTHKKYPHGRDGARRGLGRGRGGRQDVSKKMNAPNDSAATSQKKEQNPVAPPSNKAVQPSKATPTSTDNKDKSDNPWSKGPPDFAKMFRSQEGSKVKSAGSAVAKQGATVEEISKQDIVNQDKLEKKQPGANMAERKGNRGRGSKTIGSEQTTSQITQLTQPQTVQRPVTEEKKEPSWADRLTKRPSPRSQAKSEASTSQMQDQGEKEKKLDSSKAEVLKTQPSEDDNVKQTADARTTQQQTHTPTHIAEDENSLKQENEPRVDKVKGEPVKLPANFGVPAGAAFQVAFGSRYRPGESKQEGTKAIPSAWGQESKDSSRSAKDGSNVVEETGVSESNELESSQQQFMTDLMSSTSTVGKREDPNLQRKKPQISLSPESVVQQSLNDGTAVNVADFESKMIAAVDKKNAEALEAGTSESMQNMGSHSQMQAQVLQESKQLGQQSSHGPSQQQHNVQATFSKQQLPETGSQHTAEHQFPQKPNRSKQNPRMRPNMNKSYNMGGSRPGTGLPTSQESQGNQHPAQGNIDRRGGAPYITGSQYQQQRIGQYNQPRPDMYSSSYGSMADPFYGRSGTQPISGPPPGMGPSDHPNLSSHHQIPGQVQRQHKESQHHMQQSVHQQHQIGGTRHLDQSEQQSLSQHQQSQQPGSQSQVNHPQQGQYSHNQQGGQQLGQQTQSQQSQQHGQQGNQQSSSQQPYGMSQSGPNQFGQNFNPPPGMNPMQFQGGMPPYFPNAYNFYGYPQYSGSQFGGPSPQSQFPAQHMYESGVPAGFGGPSGMYDQQNMYQGYENVPGYQGNNHSHGASNSSSSNVTGPPSSTGNNQTSMNIGGNVPSNVTKKPSGAGANSNNQAPRGPPGYPHPQQNFSGYSNQQYQQPGQAGNYFMQQPPMGFPPRPFQQQQQQQHRSGSQPLQQQNQSSHGGWNSNR